MGIYQGVKLLGNRVYISLALLDRAKQFSKVAVPIPLPKCIWVLVTLPPHSVGIYGLFNFSHTGKSVVILIMILIMYFITNY